MATLLVTTNSDSGDDATLGADLAADMTDGGGLSLREAIGRAASGDTITFDLDGATTGNQGGTITLGGTELTLSQNITIDGDLDGDDIPDVTISGNNASRIFNLTGGTITLDGLTVTGGNAGANNGGGVLISNGVTATIQNSVINNNAANLGAGIEHIGTQLTIENSRIDNNAATGVVGGIRSLSDLTINNSSLVGNSSGNVRALFQNGGTLNITNTTFAQHTSGSGGATIQASSNATVNITNSTITGSTNVALSLFNGADATVTNSIIASTSSTVSLEPNSLNTGTSLTFSGTNILSESAIGSTSGTAPTIQSSLSNIFAGTVTTDNVSGGALQTAGNVQVAITQSNITAGAAPNNDAPVITLPSVADITEDATNVAIADTIQIADTDNDNQTVTITPTGGTVSIDVSGSGVNVTTGDGTDDSSLVFTGTLTQVNSALDSLTFSPTLNLNGTNAGSIRVQTSDGIVLGTDDETVTFDITSVADTFTVTTTSDSGDNLTVAGDLAAETADGGGLSLREAILLAHDGDTITFDSSLNGQTLTLSSELAISDDITIDGDFVGNDNSADVTLSGGDTTRLFNITGGTVNLEALTITDGNVTNLPVVNGTEQRGGAILVGSGATLNVSNSTISSSRAAEGGGFAVNGTANISNSLIMTNSATLNGGGIAAFGGTTTVTSSTITQNTGASSGGLITSGGSITVSGSTVSGNRQSGTSANRFDEAFGFSGTISFANSIVGNSGGQTDLGGSISFSGPTILTAAFGSSSNVTVSTPASIFTSTQTIGGVTTGTLADNGGTVQSIAILPSSEGGVAQAAGTAGANVGAGPVVSGNAAPSISIADGTLSYTEGQNLSPQLDSTATLSDADGDADWNGGTLVAQITSNANAADRILISNSENVSLSGTSISVDNTVIGTLSVSAVSSLGLGGATASVTGGTALTITFNASATNASVQTVLRNLRFGHTGDDPGSADRTITITATDTNGGAATDTRTVSIAEVEDNPTVSATAANPTFTEDGAAVAPFTGASISPVEGSQTITAFNVILQNAADGSSETLTIDGTNISVVAGGSGTTSGNSLSYSVVSSGGNLEVRLTGGTLTGAQANTIINGITYSNSSDNPTTTNARTIAIDVFQDSGSGVSSGAITSDVTVVAANDAPTSTNASPLINDNATKVFTAADFNFSDADTGDTLQSVRIDSITLTSGTFQLSGTDVTVGQVITIADINAGNLVYTPVNNVIDQTANRNLLEFTHSVSDGTAFASTPNRIQVEVSPVADAPTATSAPSSIRVGVETASNVNLSSITVADVDSSNVSLTISVDTGTLSTGTLPGTLAMLSIQTSVSTMGGGNSVRIRGTVSEINAFLDDPTLLQYTSASGITGENAATLTISDATSRSAALATVSINIGAAPVSAPTTPTITPVDDNDTNGRQQTGTSLNDSLGGSGGNDTLSGGNGGDTLIGGVGDDFVAGGNGNDRSFAGANDAGNDTLQGNGGNDVLAGGAGNDTIVGGNFSSTADQFNSGNSGADTLFGGAGNDLIVGGSYNSSTNTVVNTGQGTNTIWAGTGNDTVFGDNNEDVLGGGSDGDSISGGDGNDTIFGGSGNDTVDAGNDDDRIFTGQGNDTIDGGDGDDTLFGGAGDDTVSGGDGADEIWAGGGNDDLSGGEGADTFVFGQNSGNDTVTDFNASEDVLNLEFAPTDFTSLAEVTAAASETTQGGQSGVLIDLGGSQSVFIQGINLSDLTATSVTF